MKTLTPQKTAAAGMPTARCSQSQLNSIGQLKPDRVKPWRWGAVRVAEVSRSEVKQTQPSARTVNRKLVLVYPHF